MTKTYKLVPAIHDNVVFKHAVLEETTCVFCVYRDKTGLKSQDFGDCAYPGYENRGCVADYAKGKRPMIYIDPDDRVEYDNWKRIEEMGL